MWQGANATQAKSRLNNSDPNNETHIHHHSIHTHFGFDLMGFPQADMSRRKITLHNVEESGNSATEKSFGWLLRVDAF